MNTQLGQHTFKLYDARLDHLMETILQMGAHVRELVLTTKRALHERSDALVAAAKAADAQINALDKQIEEEAITVLALQNPMAVDLRFVTSALKIAAALERAGDLAKNNVKRCAKLGEYKSSETVVMLEKMADEVVAMLDGALNAVKDSDSAKATDVWRQDDAVDDLYHAMFTAMQKEMVANPASIPACTHILFIAKNFERLADYATNLAKTVHYVVSGKPPSKALLKGEA